MTKTELKVIYNKALAEKQYYTAMRDALAIQGKDTKNIDDVLAWVNGEMDTTLELLAECE